MGIGKFWIKPAKIRSLHQIPAWDRRIVTLFSFGLPPDLLFATSNKTPTSLLCPFAHLHLILSCCWIFSAVWEELSGKLWMVDQDHFPKNSLDCFSKISLNSLNLCVQKHVWGTWEGEQKGTAALLGDVASASSWVKHEGFDHWGSRGSLTYLMAWSPLSSHPTSSAFWFCKREPLFQVSHNEKIYGTPR